MTSSWFSEQFPSDNLFSCLIEKKDLSIWFNVQFCLFSCDQNFFIQLSPLLSQHIYYLQMFCLSQSFPINSKAASIFYILPKAIKFPQ